MKHCRLDGRTLAGMADLHRLLAESLDFPEWYGGNLDALWDMLTAEVAGPFEVEFVHLAEARRRLGAGLDPLLDLLREAQAERQDFHLRLSEEES